MAASAQTSVRSAPRDEAILDATLGIIGRRGLEAVTHRSVAREAGVSLGAISHHFPSREILLEETLAYAAGREVARLERLALELQAHAFDTEEWVAAVAGALAGDLRRDPSWGLVQYELLLACARNSNLRELAREWRQAHLRLAEVGLRAAGSPAPHEHAQLLVATITGLLLKQLAYPTPKFEAAVLHPLLAELVNRLTSSTRRRVERA